MSTALSLNTQAILLLTAPLVAGRGDDESSEALTLGEYKKLARFLRDAQREPADLLAQDATDLLVECQRLIDAARLDRLLHRGFLLSQAIERWQARAIWVVGRADAAYPKRLKMRLREDAPPVIYGCGDAAILETGGLAIVGSRHVGDELIEYTQRVGRLAAAASRTGDVGKGLEALRKKGAAAWPDPMTSEQFAAALSIEMPSLTQPPDQQRLDLP